MTWKMPKLELGEVDAIGADGAEGILYDEATIYFADDPENYSIDVECDGALRVAGFIVDASNNYEALVEMLKDASLQIEYLQEKLPSPTGTGVAILVRINGLLAAVSSSPERGK